MLEKPIFLQGVYSFHGKGLKSPVPLEPAIHLKVPSDKRCQLTYFRAGNASSELIYFVVMRDGSPMRYFPVSAKGATHIPLAVVEDLQPDASLEVLIAAPDGSTGEVVVDAGLMEF